LHPLYATHRQYTSGVVCSYVCSSLDGDGKQIFLLSWSGEVCLLMECEDGVVLNWSALLFAHILG